MSKTTKANLAEPIEAQPEATEEVVIESIAEKPEDFAGKLIAFLESEKAKVSVDTKRKHMLHVKRGDVEFVINSGSAPEYLKLTLATFGFDASKFEEVVEGD